MSPVSSASGNSEQHEDIGRKKFWNPQQPSSMPFRRYVKKGQPPPGAGSARRWPAHHIATAPLWASVDLRDGNQALPEPMDVARKMQMFDLLVSIGFKEVEVGYPSASEADFSFVRHLITSGAIPDDVVVSVFTPARPELIDRTFEAVAGLERGIVHLCNATACLWREHVFATDAAGTRRMAVESAQRIAALAEDTPRSDLRFEYSPETFNSTEPEFALEVCEAVMDAWSASPTRPVTINLPSTVETDTPNVYADQIEWMNDNLTRRDSTILSVHPHNDRGTAVASAELALMAGADRVEGTLFGNGERTGNVCLSTLALNLFSHGVDPELELGDIDDVRSTVETCNRLPVHPRHPYVGDLVYTAFSGTHQDAIAKGFARLSREATAHEVAPDALEWDVPYLPVDPRDLGRSYESVIRVNSQSGSAGIAEALREAYGIELPRPMRREFAVPIQEYMDRNDRGVTSRQLWEMLQEFYACPPELGSVAAYRDATDVAFAGSVRWGGAARDISVERADDVEVAVRGALTALGAATGRHHATTTRMLPGSRGFVVAQTTADLADTQVHGLGIAESRDEAIARAVLSVAGRSSTLSPVRA